MLAENTVHERPVAAETLGRQQEVETRNRELGTIPVHSTPMAASRALDTPCHGSPDRLPGFPAKSISQSLTRGKQTDRQYRGAGGGE